MSEPFTFGRLSLARLDLHSAVGWVLSAADQKKSCIVVTSNIHHLALAQSDVAFREVVDKAELNVADGWPIVVASRLLEGPRLPGRIAGVDLVTLVLTTSDRLRIAVLGGAPGAAERLVQRFGGHHDFVVVEPLVVGTWEGETQLADLRRRVGRGSPDLVLVAIGAPRQELLAESLRPNVRGPIICCGAAVEIITGVRPRAPVSMQKLGLEWAFRALMEPSRLLPRYLRAGALFLLILVRELGSRTSSGTRAGGS